MIIPGVTYSVLILMFPACTAVALLVLLMVSRLSSSPRNADDALSPAQAGSRVFLFRHDRLVDMSDAGRSYLQGRIGTEFDLQQLVSFLSPRFGGLADGLHNLGEDDPRIIESDDGTTRLHLVSLGNTLRLSMTDTGPPAATAQSQIEALEEELHALRLSVHESPQLVWQESPQGDIVWANSAYFEHAAQLTADDRIEAWPPPRLFRAFTTDTPVAPTGKHRRLSLRITNEDGTVVDNWFDVTSKTVKGGSIHFANDANAVVAGETAQRNFVQTLTKTFAQLSIGLAIFNRSRELSLFNPALVELTTLPVDFLSNRPTLYAFLDKLRSMQMIPEPKDYGSWRQQILALEAAAEDGTYSEVWNLAGGVTFRVTGRPHPDGAVAFLLEDISAEVSLTRRFRSEIEMAQSVIDNVGEAIAVFSHGGALLRCNQPYCDLWGVDHDADMSLVTIDDAAKLWRSHCRPSPVWGEVRDFMATYTERAEWSDDVMTNAGWRLNCRVTPLAGGTTLVSFARVGYGPRRRARGAGLKTVAATV